jgi:hypothetical protein
MPRFKLPAGFALPEGTQEGQDFQVVMTAKVLGDEVEITEMEGITLEGYEEPEEEEETEEVETVEEEAVPGETAGDRFNKKFRGKVSAY